MRVSEIGIGRLRAFVHRRFAFAGLESCNQVSAIKSLQSSKRKNLGIFCNQVSERQECTIFPWKTKVNATVKSGFPKYIDFLLIQPKNICHAEGLITKWF
ncbi:hypothetical protein GOP47_0022994 [Adiantum capillus-veneris]|uniref:Uncharacterized protein n=1 Tax=Adiantum capillus-veneris TaxID=13818 RepID=A0A9D4Z626_ADICA|nr:hypothetical protein GOP47_0022994 [Adiantum capillus-veneris]